MSNMEKHLFNLKFTAKEFNRNSKKCDKEEKAEKTKIKKISALMDKCEHQFEAFDVQTQQMEDTKQVDVLLQEMADETGSEFN